MLLEFETACKRHDFVRVVLCGYFAQTWNVLAVHQLQRRIGQCIVGIEDIVPSAESFIHGFGLNGVAELPQFLLKEANTGLAGVWRFKRFFDLCAESIWSNLTYRKKGSREANIG